MGPAPAKRRGTLAAVRREKIPYEGREKTYSMVPAHRGKGRETTGTNSFGRKKQT